MAGYSKWFQQATGQNRNPFPFQRRFAEAAELSSLVHVPTGLGKTAMVVLGWMWRRFGAQDDVRARTPRRLVYCLPMRVLVEQTRDEAAIWIANLHEDKLLQQDIPIHILMGGEDQEDWEICPEGDAIVIGTQDMLLSRALNRGYAAGRSRWPMQFGLLHTDCLWVFDEIQLMGSGLATTAQLEAFRYLLGSQDGHGCHSVWMSATMQADWLKTVDFEDRVKNLSRLSLDDEDHKNRVIQQRWRAVKPLGKASKTMDDVTGLTLEILKAHKLGTRTIIVVNTVIQACELHKSISKQWKSADTQRLVLLHSRFRPVDRKLRVDEALANPPSGGTIIVSTQVIEAGVDVSATTLFTALAPWASLVQRFGRCNRRGDQNEMASASWIDVADKEAAPYQQDDLIKSRKSLGELQDVGLQSLHAHPVVLPFRHTHVIRRRDLIDLFDTTPDLAGNDIDIDRFVREVEDSDVRAFWRDYDKTPNATDGKDAEPAPRREELCPAPVGEFREFVKKHFGQVWRWDFLDRKWQKVDPAKISPGQVYLVDADAGGYAPDRGWDAKSKSRVEPIPLPVGACAATPEATDDERLSHTDVWQTIAEHTDGVCRELDAILSSLSLGDGENTPLRDAARWHDWGKAHAVFRSALPDEVPDAALHWAKAAGTWKRYGRPHFRHELVSALAVLGRPHETLRRLSEDDLNLVAYLIAAHHGKVRLSIRSLPNEARPPANNGQPRRFARGVWDGDPLPETDLGGGVKTPVVTLSLEPMELGLCESPPFTDQPSWAERMIRLRETLGPFRLSHLEAILRSADWRASRNTGQHGASDHQAEMEASHA